MAFLTGYTKRKPLPFVDDGVLNTSYQIKFNPKKTTGSDSGSIVYLGSNVQDDFDDFRVTKIDNTELDQWQEALTSGTEATYWAEIHKVGSSLLSGNAASGQKVVNVNAGSVFAANDWVWLVCDTHGELCQIDSISTNELTMKSNLANAYTTAANAKVCHAVYVYYNNSGASLSSNGANTFPVFDKFDDASQWSGDTARASVAGNILTFTALAGTTWYYLYNNTTLSNNVRGRMSANLTNADFNVVSIGSAAKEYWNEVGTGHDSTKTNHSSWATSDGDSFTAISNTAIGFDADHIFEFHRLLTGTDTARAFYDNASVGADVTTDVGTAAYTIRIRAYAGSHLHLNWVWLAQSTYNDATLIGTWGAEETSVIVKVEGETVGLSEGGTRRFRSKRLEASTVGLTDADQRRLRSIRAITEAIGLSEADTRRLRSIRISSETVGLSDGLLRRLRSIRIAAEAIGITEAHSLRARSIRLAAETLSITEALLIGMRSVRIIAETIGISESLLRRLRSIRLIAESLSITEAALYRLRSIRFINEAISLSEALRLRMRSIRAVNEAIGITESGVKKFLLRKIANEAIGITEAANRRLRSIRIIAETVSILESWRYWQTMLRVLRMTLKLPSRDATTKLKTREITVQLPSRDVTVKMRD